MIKVNGKLTPYTRYFYKNFIGYIPPGHIVYHKDFDTLNDSPDNLALTPRRLLRTSENIRTALSLLAERADKIGKKIETINHAKMTKSEIRSMYSELIRIKNLQRKLK
ncbi:MAG: HNH endonuclease [Prevotellaceae bacterium]|nr:HNH endonuclease [Prevotellaceae bacterium]